MKKKTYYHLILDQSGSMQDCISETISGYNEQMQLLRSLKDRYPDQEIRVGLTRFNSEVLPSFQNADPQSVKDLDNTLYKPEGMTALYDAIGSSVYELNLQVGEELRAGIATVVVVILTDGHENVSKRYNHAAIQSMIKELEASGKWTFSYIGATLDAVEVAKGLNIKGGNSMSFEKRDMNKAYGRISSSMNAYMQKRATGKDLSQFLTNEED
jgi:hypothetical protein